MPSLNRVTLIGHLGSDPDLKYTPSNIPVCKMTVATSEKKKDRSGERSETTEWHRIVVWKEQAEFCWKYLNKGSLVFVEGRIQTRSWDGDNGQKRYATEIVAYKVLSLSKKPKAGDAEDAFEQSGGSDAKLPIDDDDIPF